jgi:hypothetical protein
MLQGVETEIGQFGDLFVWSPYAKDTAGILRTLLAGKKIVA